MTRMLPEDERREQLLNAAAKVFSEKGFAGAKVADIVAAAGVAQGTFYLYFHSKSESFEALIRRFLDVLFDKIDAESSAPTSAAAYADLLEQRLLRTLEICYAHRHLAQIFFREGVSLDPSLTSTFRELHDLGANQIQQRLDQLVAHGWARPMDTTIVARALFGMTEQIVRQLSLKADVEPNLAHIAHELCALELQGILAPGSESRNHRAPSAVTVGDEQPSAAAHRDAIGPTEVRDR